MMRKSVDPQYISTDPHFTPNHDVIGMMFSSQGQYSNVKRVLKIEHH